MYQKLRHFTASSSVYNKPLKFVTATEKSVAFTRTRFARLLAGRYMHMKIKILLIILIACQSTFASECEQRVSISSEEVSITPDKDRSSGMYHIRVPREFQGNELKLLILSAESTEGKEHLVISMPLAIKYKGNLTGSYFHMSSNWLKVRVAASYGKNLCTELVATLSM